MVHNGIEYGDMQLISEAFQLLREGLSLEVDRLAEIFADWNRGPLESYLIEITAEILRVKDRDGTPRVDRILDSAGQKGTGKWTAIDALERGVPLTLIGEAVNARFLSALKGERVGAARILRSTVQPESPRDDIEVTIGAVRDALYAAKIVSYAQGFMLMRAASEAHGWKLAYGDVALLWRAGCIIRSRFLADIKTAFEGDRQLSNLLLDPFFADALLQAETGWRTAIGLGVARGIPLPALTAALAFYDGYRRESLPANLLQAQRDYFGAHSYRRIDAPADAVFHTDWVGDQTEVRLDD
jgi:6-phosphogluconate dehydrogenase